MNAKGVKNKITPARETYENKETGVSSTNRKHKKLNKNNIRITIL